MSNYRYKTPEPALVAAEDGSVKIEGAAEILGSEFEAANQSVFDHAKRSKLFSDRTNSEFRLRTVVQCPNISHDVVNINARFVIKINHAFGPLNDFKHRYID